MFWQVIFARRAYETFFVKKAYVWVGLFCKKCVFWTFIHSTWAKPGNFSLYWIKLLSFAWLLIDDNQPYIRLWSTPVIICAKYLGHRQPISSSIYTPNVHNTKACQSQLLSSAAYTANNTSTTRAFHTCILHMHILCVSPCRHVYPRRALAHSFFVCRSRTYQFRAKPLSSITMNVLQIFIVGIRFWWLWDVWWIRWLAAVWAPMSRKASSYAYNITMTTNAGRRAMTEICYRLNWICGGDDDDLFLVRPWNAWKMKAIWKTNDWGIYSDGKDTVMSLIFKRFCRLARSTPYFWWLQKEIVYVSLLEKFNCALHGFSFVDFIVQLFIVYSVRMPCVGYFGPH